MWKVTNYVIYTEDRIKYHYKLSLMEKVSHENNKVGRIIWDYLVENNSYSSILISQELEKKHEGTER